MSENPPRETERLAQILAFAVIEAIAAGLLDRYLQRIEGAIVFRRRVVPAPRVGTDTEVRPPEPSV